MHSLSFSTVFQGSRAQVWPSIRIGALNWVATWVPLSGFLLLKCPFLLDASADLLLKLAHLLLELTDEIYHTLVGMEDKWEEADDVKWRDVRRGKEKYAEVRYNNMKKKERRWSLDDLFLNLVYRWKYVF